MYGSFKQFLIGFGPRAYLKTMRKLSTNPVIIITLMFASISTCRTIKLIEVFKSNLTKESYYPAFDGSQRFNFPFFCTISPWFFSRGVTFSN